MQRSEDRLRTQLKTLKLRFIQEHYPSLVEAAAREQWSPLELLTRLIEGESECRSDRALLRRLKAARFPVLKTLEGFDWSWPRKINRPLVQDLFRLVLKHCHHGEPTVKKYFIQIDHLLQNFLSFHR